MPWWKQIPWMGSLKVIGILAGVGYAVVTFFQWQDLRSNFKTSQRPWAYIPIAVGITTDRPLTFSEDRTTAETWISSPIRNTGISPALNAMQQSTLVIAVEPMLIAGVQRNSPCDKNFIEQATKVVGFFVAPGDTVKTEPGKVPTTMPFPRQGEVSAVLQLCTGYRDQFGHSHGTGTNWHYVTTSGKTTFEPTGTIEGHWEYFGLGGTAY